MKGEVKNEYFYVSNKISKIKKGIAEFDKDISKEESK